MAAHLLGRAGMTLSVNAVYPQIIERYIQDPLIPINEVNNLTRVSQVFREIFDKIHGWDLLLARYLSKGNFLPGEGKKTLEFFYILYLKTERIKERVKIITGFESDQGGLSRYLPTSFENFLSNTYQDNIFLTAPCLIRLLNHPSYRHKVVNDTQILARTADRIKKALPEENLLCRILKMRKEEPKTLYYTFFFDYQIDHLTPMWFLHIHVKQLFGTSKLKQWKCKTMLTAEKIALFAAYKFSLFPLLTTIGPKEQLTQEEQEQLEKEGFQNIDKWHGVLTREQMVERVIPHFRPFQQFYPIDLDYAGPPRGLSFIDKKTLTPHFCLYFFGPEYETDLKEKTVSLLRTSKCHNFFSFPYESPQ